MAIIKQDLGQLFENNSNCYADTEDNSVVMAMDKEMFVKVVTDLLTERAVANDDTGERQLTIPDVNNLVCPTHGTKLYKHPNGMAYCSLCNYSIQWQTCC